ncbi:MAG TPA: T9SS type A sorting domain-containing protein [Ignavibacteria bacterium]|nr:T9SS type A sorting domain-containing protein [Ignavibacteria bacterium]
MKTIIINFNLLFLLLFTNDIFSQSLSSSGLVWSDEVRITAGYDDRNPQFGNRVYPTMYALKREFLVFERYINSNQSNIMYFEFSTNGIINSTPINLTTNNSINKNVTLSYNRPMTQSDTAMKSCLVVWQSNRNGKWDLYGKKYFPALGWTDITIDDGTGDKTNPNVIFLTDSTYLIVYEKNSDIFYREINTFRNIVSHEINITQTPVTKEFNPVLCNLRYSNSNLCLTFERIKPDSTKSLYFSKSEYPSVNFNNIVILDTTGDNSKAKYFNDFSSGIFNVVYEKTIQGITKIKCIGIQMNSAIINKKVMNDSLNQTKNYTNFQFPILVDNGVNTLNSLACMYQVIKNNRSNLIFAENAAYNFSSINDSIYIGDANAITEITMNMGIFIPFASFKIYGVYTKDSVNVSSLYMKSKVIYTTSVNKISNITPENFVLNQNYPNPFNAGTKIRFAVKENNAFVNLSVYDVSGRLIKNLVNDKFNAGEYEYLYDAEGLSSGVYFYSLQSGEFSETKRMVLVK